jgi:hypothetical protein
MKTQASPFADKQPSSKAAVMLQYCYGRRFTFFAILVHAVLIIFFGDYILLSSWFKNTEEAASGTFVSAPKTAPVQTEEITTELAVPADEQAAQAAATDVPLPQIITTTNPHAAQNIPSIENDVSSKLFAAVGSPGIQGGTGSGTSGTGIKNVTSGSLFGMKVQAEKLAVVLDGSASMWTVIKEVETEIKSKFPKAVFLLNFGCVFLDDKRAATLTKTGNTRGVDRAWAEGKGNKLFIEYFPNFPKENFFFRMNKAVLHAASLPGIDAVWLFADYQDFVDEESVSEMRSTLASKKIKLYIHSVEENVPPCLVETCKSTGGAYTIKPLK